MKPNPGHLPRDAVGKRVVVRLTNGREHGRAPVNVGGKLGWDAMTTRWSRTGSPFDVAAYRVL